MPETTLPARVISRRSGWASLDFSELWRYRELLVFLTWRDIIVRYKQTAIGIAWAVLKPLVAMVVLAIVFGVLAGLPSDGVPYPILTLVGLLPWLFFSGALSDASGSVVANKSLISKIYFPRIFIPTSAVLAGFVDFLISFILLLGLYLLYGLAPPARVFYLPVFTALAFLAALSMGLWFSALNVEYRDFRYVVPFVVQIGLYISPVGFSSGVVPEGWRLLYSLNPMVGVIDGFRWALLPGQAELYLPGLWLSIGTTLALFATGTAVFRRMEHSFADVI